MAKNKKQKKPKIELEKEVYVEVKETKWANMWACILVYPFALLMWLIIGIIFIIIGFIPILNTKLLEGVFASDYYDYDEDFTSKYVKKKIYKDDYASSEQVEIYRMED